MNIALDRELSKTIKTAILSRLSTISRLSIITTNSFEVKNARKVLFHDKIFILAHSNLLWPLFSKHTEPKRNNIANIKIAISKWLAVKKIKYEGIVVGLTITVIIV